MAKIDNIFKTETKKAETHPRRNSKWIHYTKLRGNRKQYRSGGSEEARELTRRRVEQLADLIEADGEVLQELLVKKIGPDEYEIIAGHHRCMACKVLVEERGKSQFEFLPCIIRELSEVREEFALYSTNGYDNKTDYEIMHELERMKYLLEHYPEEFPEVPQAGRMVERLANLLNMKKTSVGEYFNISKNLGKKGMEKFQAGELKKSAAVQLASLPEEEQDQLIDSGKTSIVEVKAYKRKLESKENEDAKKREINPSVSDQKEFMPGQYVITDVECNMEEEQEESNSPTPKSTEEKSEVSNFPVLKNMEERERFVDNYKEWNVWCRNTFTEEIFYRYDLPDESAIIVKEYPYSTYWDRKQERIGTQLYLICSDTKYFKDAETNMTNIKEHLKCVEKSLNR